MANQTGHKPIHSIILDTGPLIKNAVSISTIIASAVQLYTTPAIVSEIRDAATRSRVETTLMPFLNIRTPSAASYEAVAAFAKKTGDFPVLSRQDLGILALAYEMHCERHGGPWELRNAPGAPLNQKPEGKKDEEKVPEKGAEGQTQDLVEEKTAEESVPAASEEKSAAQMASSRDESAGQEAQSSEEPIEKEVQAQEQPVEQHASSEPTAPALESAPAIETIEEDLSNLRVSEPAQTKQLETSPASSEDDNSDGGKWITPSNLKKYQAKHTGNTTLTADQPQVSVATMTTDFAMQNVLLQLNLPLLSTNMQRIKNIRTQILRCHACFFTTKEMSKQFCPRCGQLTLNRVNCHTNAKGEFRLHLARNYQYNKRGNRYSIPKPVAGTASGKHAGKGGGKNGWGKDLVLAEDQKEYTRQVDVGKKSKARDLMDEDYLPGILSGDRGRAGGRPKVGAGRNINSRKRL